ncbi:MAG: hypothetical protein F9K47_16780 [Burkholderiales bacterium]|nr:MAG: hypothetical protein F9K47_16780 [Burkholderiales bacterium]
MKKKPIGFVARCPCGVIVNAMFYDDTDRRKAGQILGQWLSEGCTVEPRFEASWSAVLGSCRCGESSDLEATARVFLHDAG